MGAGGVTGGELHKESVIQIQCKLNCGILFELFVYFKKRRHFIFWLSTLSSDVLTQDAPMRNEEFCLVVRYKKVHIMHHRKKVGELTLNQQLKSKLKGFC